MSFETNCATIRKNTGVQGLCQDIGPLKLPILTPPDFSITEANARLKATWDAAISAAIPDRIYPFPPAVAMTDNSEEAIFEEMALGNLFVRDGKVILQFMMESSRYKHEALKSHTLQKVGVILVDLQDRIHGVTDGTNLQCIKLQQFVVNKLTLNDGAGVATKTMVTMIFADTEKWENSPAVISGLDWSPNELQGLTDIVVTVGTATGSAVPVTLKVSKSGEAFTAVIGDLVVKDSGGVVKTITSVTPPVAGMHVLNFTSALSAGTYTVNLLAPSAMTTKGFESLGSAEFTISA